MKLAAFPRRARAISVPVILLACVSCKSGKDKEEQGEEKAEAAKTDTSASKVVDTPKPLPVRELPQDSGEHQGKLRKAVSAGSEDSDDVRGSALANNGDIVLCGYFKGKTIFGQAFANEDAAAYVARFAKDTGELAWVVPLGGKGEDAAEEVAVAPDDSVVVVGSTSGEIQIGDGKLKAKGADDIFIAKFAADGRRLWAKQLGGTDSDGADSVAIDKDGNIFVTGVLRNTVEVGETVLENHGNADIFLAKYSPEGELSWIQRYGDVGEDFGRNIGFDSQGNIVLVAEISAQVSFGGDALPTQGNRDIAIVKLSQDGKQIWAKAFGNNYDDIAVGLAIDPSDNLLLSGSFEGELSLGGPELVAKGRSDMFIAKFDTNGEHVWSKAFGGKDKDWANTIASDAFGNSYVTGWFWYEVEMGAAKLVSKGREDVFVAKLDPQGEVLWANAYGSPRLDKGKQVVALEDGVFVAGAYNESIDFGQGALKPTPGNDPKLVKGDLFFATFDR